MKKRFVIFFIFFFVLLIYSVSSAPNWIYKSNSVLVSVNISSEMQVSGSVKDLRVNITMYPETSDFQTVISQSTQPEALNYVFFWQDPAPGKLLFRVDSQVRTFEKIRPIYSKVKFPVSSLEQKFRKYIEPTEIIDSNNPQIVAKATELASGESDVYRLVHKIGAWVRENIEYDLDPALVFSTNSASWTLKNKRAVCDEMTTLFIALNRAVGIPARFVSGYAYTDDPRFRQGWGPHAWAEVYFPGNGWVPIDVTYGQLGDVDLTHIELKKSHDATTTSAYYSWYNGDIETKELDINIELISTAGIKQAPISIKTSVLESKVGFGSYDLFEVELNNKNNYYEPVTLVIGAPDIVEIIGKNVAYVLLEPEQTKKLYWMVKIKRNLDPGYIYTAHLAAASLRTNSTTKLEISDNYNSFSFDDMQQELDERQEQEERIITKDVLVDCDYDSIFYIGDEHDISCKLINLGNVNFDNLKVCIANNCESVNLKINQQADVKLVYTPKATNEEVAIQLSGKDISQTQKLDVQIFGKPEINIKINSPDSVKFDQEFSININISKTESPIQNSKLKVYTNQRLMFEKELDDLDSKQLSLNMRGSDLDKSLNNLKIQVEYSDMKDRLFYESAESQINLEKLTLWQSIIYFFTHLFA
ncbi:transglutaminase domain-containing protein [Candidatus Woesearchaeota archaeon]|nr:transglutaminase domain-containing protein [Candidatus Woesearchaeota archaeon]